MRKPYRVVLAGVVVLLALPCAALGDLMSLQVEEQSRWIRAFGKINGQTQTDLREADGFGEFDGFAEISFVVDEGMAWGSSYAYASQRSALDRLMHRTQVRYDMSIGAAFQNFPHDVESIALGETFFEVRFRLHRPHRYDFRSLRDYTFAPTGYASLHEGGLFTEAGDEIVGDFWFRRVEQTGVLSPGRYILRHHGVLQPHDSIPETEALQFTMELTAIPLPAAVWSGLATLAGLGAVGGLRGWRRGKALVQPEANPSR